MKTLTTTIIKTTLTLLLGTVMTIAIAEKNRVNGQRVWLAI